MKIDVNMQHEIRLSSDEFRLIYAALLQRLKPDQIELAKVLGENLQLARVAQVRSLLESIEKNERAILETRVMQ